MTQPTDLEQLMLELVNDARLNPMSNAARYLTSYLPLTSNDPKIQRAIDFFDVDGGSLLSAYTALSATTPLAWNENLATAAHDHSQAQIDAQQQSHQVAGEASLGVRLTASGYTGWITASENVYAYAENVMHGHAGFMIDWGYGANGMQDPAGHRIAIMNPVLTEIGIDITVENSPLTPLGPLVITEDFGNRNKTFLLGVAYTDTDRNNFYSVGEGRNDLQVSHLSKATSSSSSGGYTLEITPGLQDIALSGGGLIGVVNISGEIAQNTKIDVVNGTTLLVSGSVTATGEFTELRALGVKGLALTAGMGNQLLAGTPSNDVLNGGLGTDIAEYSGVHTSYALNGTATDFSISGETDGTDRLLNIEILRFSDGDYTWSPTSGLIKAGEVVPPPPIPSPPTSFDWKLLSVDGNSATIGGIGQVFGTTGYQSIIIENMSGYVSLDPSFNRGGDLVMLSGQASDWSATTAGSGVLLFDGKMQVEIPAGIGGLLLEFEDGRRELKIDTSVGSIMIGDQEVTDSPSFILAPSQNLSAPFGLQQEAFGALILSEGGAVTAGGNIELFGTSASEEITLLSSRVNLDPSFNRGGDSLVLIGSSETFEATVIGSSVFIANEDYEVQIPVGAIGMDIQFSDTSGILRYDSEANAVFIGDQIISAEAAPLSFA